MLLLLWLAFLDTRVETAAPATNPPDFGGDPHLGYGFNVAQWDVSLLQSLGFDWMKVFDTPNSRQPVNILLRINANAQNMGNLNAFGRVLPINWTK
jgi:hypothetical protein